MTEKRKKEDVFFEIATAKEERKSGSGARPLRPANRKRPRRTGIGSENGRRADECRPAAGLWRFFFYETAAGTLAADRLHASKPVCFNLCAFALKNQMVNEDPLENRQTKERRKHCIAHSRRILDLLRKRRRADVNERRLFFFGKSRLERYKAREDELRERLDYFEDKKQVGAKRTLLRRGGEGGIRTLEAR